MIMNDVPAEVRDVVETIITTVVDKLSNIDDEISPLAVTPRISLNRTAAQQRPHQQQVPARKSLFGATNSSITSNNPTIVSNTPTDISPSNNDRSDNAQNCDFRPSESMNDTLFSQGYDSDGLMAEYTNIEYEMHECEMYNNIKVGANDRAEVAVPRAAVEAKFVLISDADIKKLKVDHLRTELKMRGLGRGGLKAELVARLKQAMIDKVPMKNDQASEAANAVVFATGAYWKVLTPDDTEIEDPNHNTQFHAPTVGEEEVPVVKKMNYPHVFDRAPFVGTIGVDKVDRYKRRRIDPITKEIIREQKPIGDHGAPRPEFIFENKLDSDSLPHEWFEPFVPRSLTGMWTSYTNHKALLANAGQDGEVYPDFTPFTNDRLRQEISVYMIQGLGPAPQVSMKFKSQQEDDINGNDFINRSLGPGAVRRHKHFRRFLLHSVQSKHHQADHQDQTG